MICEGCLVQGFYPHQCQLTVEREHGSYACSCGIEPGCRYWEAAEEIAQ